jgi:hypothetical protein
VLAYRISSTKTGDNERLPELSQDVLGSVQVNPLGRHRRLGFEPFLSFQICFGNLLKCGAGRMGTWLGLRVFPPDDEVTRINVGWNLQFVSVEVVYPVLDVPQGRLGIPFVFRLQDFLYSLLCQVNRATNHSPFFDM